LSRFGCDLPVLSRDIVFFACGEGKAGLVLYVGNVGVDEPFPFAKFACDLENNAPNVFDLGIIGRSFPGDSVRSTLLRLKNPFALIPSEDFPPLPPASTRTGVDAPKARLLLFQNSLIGLTASLPSTIPHRANGSTSFSFPLFPNQFFRFDVFLCGPPAHPSPRPTTPGADLNAASIGLRCESE
jgi:hypothetical protein